MLARTALAGAYENTSALYWLTENSEGRHILSNIFNSNPNLLAMISTAAWELPAKGHEERPLLYLLQAGDEYGLLTRLIKANPEIKEKLQQTKVSSTMQHGFFSLSSDPKDTVPSLVDPAQKVQL